MYVLVFAMVNVCFSIFSPPMIIFTFMELDGTCATLNHKIKRPPNCGTEELTCRLKIAALQSLSYGQSKVKIQTVNEGKPSVFHNLMQLNVL